MVERCEQCGFDGGRWTDDEAIDAVSDLPARWRRAIAGLSPARLNGRPIAGMWSIAEYTDHVRETTFGMRFILDIALAEPGADLGQPPKSVFDAEPADIDVDASIVGFEHEVEDLCRSLRRLPAGDWELSVTVGGDDVDPHWMVRHALHDVSHHIGDVEHLRAALA